MNQQQRDIVTCYKTDLFSVVDPITIAISLLKQEDSKRELFERIQAKIKDGLSRNELWEALLPDILSNCSFASFWLALNESGYDILSTKLLLKFWHSPSLTEITPGPQRTECDDQMNFLILKACFHDQAFKHPGQLLVDKSENLRTKYENASGVGKMKFADRYGYYLCVLIDMQAMKFIGRFPSHDLFDRLGAMITNTGNTSLTEVAYYSRLAIAHGMANNMEKGRECMAKAHLAAFQIEQNVQYVYNMLYIHIHFLCMQVDIPTSNDIYEIFELTKLLMQSLPVNDDGAIFWKKMLVLRIVCFLLGISHKGVINERHKVEKEHVADAKKFLTIIDAHWNGIEYIRKLFYYVCRARIQELEFMGLSGQHLAGDRQRDVAISSLQAAIDQLDKTIAEETESSFLEIPFAKAYLRRLRQAIPITQ